MGAALRKIDWGLLAVVAVAVALRLPYLTERSLWYDEASSWQTARFAWPDLLRSVRLNVHLPLYYVLLKAWMAAWGDSVASLRGFSVTFGALTVAAMFPFARELFRASAAGVDESSVDDAAGRRFGLFVAGLVALSPFQVLASIEARMYSLGTALAAVGAWLLLRILSDARDVRLWGAYATVSALLLYVHHYALFTVAAQVAFLAFWLVWLAGLGRGDEARSLLARAVVAFGAVGLVYLPGLLLLRAQSDRVRQDYWIGAPTWRTFSGTFSEFLVPTHGFDFLAGGWAVFGVLAASCVVVALEARRGDALVLASAVLPMVFAGAVSTVQPIWVARYFRFGHLFFLTALALAVWKLSRCRRPLRVGLAASLAGAMLAANVAFWGYLDIPGGGGPRAAVRTILAAGGAGGTILALDEFQYFPLKYYAGTRARVRLLQPRADLFWGWHLIRDGDVLAADRLEGELARGLWTVGRMPAPLAFPGLAGARPAQTFEIGYYHSLHRRVFVHHFEPREDAAAGKGPGS